MILTRETRNGFVSCCAWPNLGRKSYTRKWPNYRRSLDGTKTLQRLVIRLSCPRNLDSDRSFYINGGGSGVMSSIVHGSGERARREEGMQKGTTLADKGTNPNGLNWIPSVTAAGEDKFGNNFPCLLSTSPRFSVRCPLSGLRPGQCLTKFTQNCNAVNIYFGIRIINI